jgi:Rps23 Pro-64 3,4-dihydroxylase Tpa1-like proline 4-hydroxylase
MLDKIRDSKIFSSPYRHIVIDNFLPEKLAEIVSNQFPEEWDYKYNSPVEVKQVCNSWDKFPKETYQLFWDLCSSKFSEELSTKFDMNLSADIGLNGGGWHAHNNGGKLNIHLDYSTHPKINYQRKLNFILYLSKDWKNSWNGGLELWSHDSINNQPKECIKTIDIKFNRAVIFDTSQNSWHGVSGIISCPEDVCRKSIAVYYVSPITDVVDSRKRALFVPDDNQKHDKSVLDFIKKRSI